MAAIVSWPASQPSPAPNAVFGIIQWPIRWPIPHLMNTNQYWPEGWELTPIREASIHISPDWFPFCPSEGMFPFLPTFLLSTFSIILHSHLTHCGSIPFLILPDLTILHLSARPYDRQAICLISLQSFTDRLWEERYIYDTTTYPVFISFILLTIPIWNLTDDKFILIRLPPGNFDSPTGKKIHSTISASHSGPEGSHLQIAPRPLVSWPTFSHMLHDGSWAFTGRPIRFILYRPVWEAIS